MFQEVEYVIGSVRYRSQAPPQDMVRGSRESRLHKQAIEKLALAYERDGYDVKADHIQQFEYPRKCRMLKPDIIAEKKDQVILIEVETRSSIGTERDKMQRREFGRWAKSQDRDFRREVVV